MSLYEFLTILMLFFTVLISLRQSSITLKTVQLDHERRRKEATINHIQVIRNEYKTIDTEIITKYGSPLEESRIEELINDSDTLPKLVYLLGLFEHLAVAVNTEVFDFDILCRLSGSYIANVYKKYEGYILYRRTKNCNPKVYIDFEILKDKIEFAKSNSTDCKFSLAKCIKSIPISKT